MQNHPITDRLVDIKTVCATLSRSRASIYRDIERGDFPNRARAWHGRGVD